jgi:hypothetical protein
MVTESVPDTFETSEFRPQLTTLVANLPVINVRVLTAPAVGGRYLHLGRSPSSCQAHHQTKTRYEDPHMTLNLSSARICPGLYLLIHFWTLTDYMQHPLGPITTIRNGSVATRARYRREQQTTATALIGLLS